MSAIVRVMFSLVAILFLASQSGADNPFVKKSKPTVRDIEANLETHLGNRIVVWGWLKPTTKPSGTGIELTVQADQKSPASRIRFLAPKSLSEPIESLKDGRRVKIAGTVLAAESVRLGYTFEVEEIEILDDRDAVTATLKPMAGPLPVPDTEKIPAPAVPMDQPASKAEPPKKTAGSVPTVLIILAGGMAILLVVLGVIGTKLIRKMNANPPVKTKPIPELSAQR